MTKDATMTTMTNTRRTRATLRNIGWYLLDRLVLLALLVTTFIVVVRVLDVSSAQYMATTNPVTAAMPAALWKPLVWTGGAVTVLAWAAWWKGHRRSCGSYDRTRRRHG